MENNEPTGWLLTPFAKPALRGGRHAHIILLAPIGGEGTVMHQRDYIMRQIEEIGVVLRALLQIILSREATATEVRAELHQVLTQVGFDLDIALVADADTLLRMIAPNGEVEPGRGWMVAEAMYLDGLDAALDGRADEAHQSLEKALRLFEMFDRSTPLVAGLPEAQARVREIEARLAELDGAPHTSRD